MLRRRKSTGKSARQGAARSERRARSPSCGGGHEDEIAPVWAVDRKSAPEARCCGLPRRRPCGTRPASRRSADRRMRFRCCSSSVVEHSLGKGEVESSILSCSTIKSSTYDNRPPGSANPVTIESPRGAASRGACDRRKIRKSAICRTLKTFKTSLPPKRGFGYTPCDNCDTSAIGAQTHRKPSGRSPVS
jgi:hypothetical protein